MFNLLRPHGLQAVPKFPAREMGGQVIECQSTSSISALGKLSFDKLLVLSIEWDGSATILHRVLAKAQLRTGHST
jgi:hypothetical protein